MRKIERIAGGWKLKGGNLVMDIASDTGELKRLVVGGDFVWTPDRGGVYVQDDLTGKRYTGRDIKRIKFELKGNIL